MCAFVPLELYSCPAKVRHAESTLHSSALSANSDSPAEKKTERKDSAAHDKILQPKLSRQFMQKLRWSFSVFFSQCAELKSAADLDVVIPEGKRKNERKTETGTFQRCLMGMWAATRLQVHAKIHASVLSHPTSIDHLTSAAWATAT